MYDKQAKSKIIYKFPQKIVFTLFLLFRNLIFLSSWISYKSLLRFITFSSTRSPFDILVRLALKASCVLSNFRARDEEVIYREGLKFY